MKLSNPRLVPAMPAMAAVARAARTRQVAEHTVDVLAVLRQVQDGGACSLRTLAAGLQAHGVLTPAGKAHWSATQVQRVLVRAAAPDLLSGSFRSICRGGKHGGSTTEDGAQENAEAGREVTPSRVTWVWSEKPRTVLPPAEVCVGPLA